MHTIHNNVMPISLCVYVRNRNVCGCKVYLPILEARINSYTKLNGCCWLSFLSVFFSLFFSFPVGFHIKRVPSENRSYLRGKIIFLREHILSFKIRCMMSKDRKTFWQRCPAFPPPPTHPHLFPLNKENTRWGGMYNPSSVAGVWQTRWVRKLSE